MVRLNTPRDQPLAVQQWESLIAVNYAARPFNISRMITASEARKRCPQLITQHVATFREGEDGRWAYRDEGDHDVRTEKVSLDPYRAESKKILGEIKAALLRWAQNIDQRGCGEGKGQEQELAHMVRVEKAGIDEVFVDLSALVYGTLVERYPFLRDPDEETVMSECLPPAPTTAVDWRGEDKLVDLDVGENEEDNPDWDDLAMQVGAEIVRAVRLAVWERLKYTCSAGIARNKMMAKLGSACNKPNNQTIVRNRAVQQFLGGYKFTKIRMLGGKLGQHVADQFETEEVSELLQVPLPQMKAKLDDDTGTWLYDLIRGDEHSEVNPRTQIKSMLSTKSFRPPLDSTKQAEKWLRIFVADIYGRLVEEGILENKRRPKVITIHHRRAGQSRSRQIPIPIAKAIDDGMLFDMAKTLLAIVVTEGNIWPCSNLSLTVSGFEDGVGGNQSLEHFFFRQAKNQDTPDAAQEDAGKFSNDSRHTAKRQKTNEATRVRTVKRVSEENEPSLDLDINRDDERILDDNIPSNNSPTSVGPVAKSNVSSSAQFILTYQCRRCNKAVPEVERDEHEDWHFAMDLAKKERQPIGSVSRRGTSEKRQSRLAFG